MTGQTFLGRVMVPCGRRGQEGESTVEFAVLMPMVLLLVGFILQTGIYFHARLIASAAAQEGARSAAAYMGTDSGGRDDAQAVLSNVGGELREPEIAVERNPGAQTVTVVVKGKSLSLVPGWQPRVDVTATSPIERLLP